MVTKWRHTMSKREMVLFSNYIEFQKTGLNVSGLVSQRISLSSTPPQLNTSVPHKRATPFPPPNPSFPRQRPLSSTPKTPQFHIKNPSLQHTPQTKTVWNWGVLLWNWGGFSVELRVFGVERRGRWNWDVFGVELRDFGCWKGVVFVWNPIVEQMGSVWNLRVLYPKLLSIFKFFYFDQNLNDQAQPPSTRIIVWFFKLGH